MSSVRAPSPYCCFQLAAYPNQQFYFELFCNVTGDPGTIASYPPSLGDLQAVGDFIVAAVNNQNPAPINLTAEDGQATLSMYASGQAVTITVYQANIQTTLSVEFSTVAHFFIMASAGFLARAWSRGEAEDSDWLTRLDLLKRSHQRPAE